MKVKVLTIALMLCALMASAQLGTLRGKVTDKRTGEPLPSSAITIELDGVILAIDTARIEGEYTIRLVPLGTYTISAARAGYQTVRVSNVTVKSDQTTYVDLKLLSSTSAPEEKGKKKKVKLKRAE